MAATQQLLSEIERGLGQPIRLITKIVPRRRQDRPVHVSCVLRWILDGVRRADGEVIRLEAVRLMDRWITTPAAVARFMARQTPELGSGRSPLFDGEAVAGAAAARRAGQALERAGI